MRMLFLPSTEGSIEHMLKKRTREETYHDQER